MGRSRFFPIRKSRAAASADRWQRSPARPGTGSIPYFLPTARKRSASTPNTISTWCSPDTPTAAQIYRAFEAEAGKVQVTTHRLPRILGRVLLAVLALVCGLLFWLFVVLVQPAAVAPEAPAAQAVAAELPAEDN